MATPMDWFLYGRISAAALEKLKPLSSLLAPGRFTLPQVVSNLISGCGVQ